MMEVVVIQVDIVMLFVTWENSTLGEKKSLKKKKKLPLQRDPPLVGLFS